MPARLAHAIAAALAGAALSSSAVAADWRQFGGDPAHSGYNPDETTIGPGNVAALVASYATPVVLPAKVDGAPVYASGVVTPGGTKDLLFLFGSDSLSDFSATTGTLMAVDAATGAIVWTQATDGAPDSSTQHASASPAIDAAKQFVYSFGVDGYLHKYRIGDGTEVQTAGPTGWPQRATLKADVEKVASSLTIAEADGHEYLYAITDGYIGDRGDYQGHVLTIDLGSGVATVFNILCSDVDTLIGVGGCAQMQGGAWGRGGATFDAATGRVYVATGNGTFDADGGGSDWGDSVVALAADGSGAGGGVPLDSYTPTNFQDLQDGDIDLGSTSPALLPVPDGSAVAHLGLQVGKDALLRLIDLDDLSGAGAPAHVGGELQQLAVPQGGSGIGGMREQPAVWTNPADGSIWLFVGNRRGLSGFRLDLDANDVPQLTAEWTVTDASTSTLVANGVLYAAGTCGDDGCVVARDPATGGVLWTSPPLGGIHWQSPIVVDGALYATDNDGQLWKFAPSAAADRIFEDGFDG